MALALFCYYNITDAVEKNELIQDDVEQMKIMIVRFLCALALHLQVEGEVLQGL